MQSEALVILLQETHCTDAEKLVLPNYQLSGSSLSRKYGLATFVHERLRYTLLDQSPPTSEIEWLCVDVDGYKIVNVYKPPPTRLRTLDLPVFPHPCLYSGDFNCRHADWGYDDNSPDGECLARWASINCLALLYNAKDAASFYSDSKLSRSGEERLCRDPKTNEYRGGRNYLPISVLCVPYKILERLIYARVEPLVDPLLPKEQAGFRRGKSTVDQVVLLTQSIEDSFEAKKKAGAVFVDLTAAYDTVWHRGLTCKLLRLLSDRHMVKMIMELVRN